MPRARVANPRRRRRRRNPGRILNPGGIVSGVKQTLRGIVLPTITATAGGALTGILETRLGDKPLLSAGAKLALGIVGTALLRRRPNAAYAFYGSCVGAIGHGIGVRVGGGLLGGTKATILGGLADLAASDPEMAAVLAGVGITDLGDLVQMSQVAQDPQAMGDLVAAGGGGEGGFAGADDE